MNKKYNLLPTNKYCIERELQEALNLETLGDTQSKNDVFYLVVIRVLNNERKDLVYSYIRYNKLFIKPLLMFLISRTQPAPDNTYREPGYFLTVLDERLYDENLYDEKPNYKSNNPKDPLRLVSDYSDMRDYLVNLDQKLPQIDTITSVLQIIYRLFYITNNDSIFEILDYAVNRNDLLFIYKILYEIPCIKGLAFKLNNIKKEEFECHSLINGCCFIVKNKDEFIKRIAQNDNYKNINTGQQKHRGELNSCYNFLSLIDEDFRQNLFSHNLYHSRNKLHPYLVKLGGRKFTFQNIHMNLGNVR